MLNIAADQLKIHALMHQNDEILAFMSPDLGQRHLLFENLTEIAQIVQTMRQTVCDYYDTRPDSSQNHLDATYPNTDRI